jgi:hypothetical protein
MYTYTRPTVKSKQIALEMIYNPLKVHQTFSPLDQPGGLIGDWRTVCENITYNDDLLAMIQLRILILFLILLVTSIDGVLGSSANCYSIQDIIKQTTFRSVILHAVHPYSNCTFQPDLLGQCMTFFNWWCPSKRTIFLQTEVLAWRVQHSKIRLPIDIKSVSSLDVYKEQLKQLKVLVLFI